MKNTCRAIALYCAFVLCLLLGVHWGLQSAKPIPVQSTLTPEYSRAVRLDHGTVTDVWRLYLDSKGIGACAVTQTGEVIVPLRLWGESQGKQVDWNESRRAVIIAGKRVPSPVFLIFQTSYATPQTLEAYSGLRHEVTEKSVIVHTCAGEGQNGGGC